MAWLRSSAETVPSGRYHSTSELTMPKRSRLTSSGERSERRAPSSTAACTSVASRESSSRRRRSASSSGSLLPRTRSSSVTAGWCATSTRTLLLDDLDAAGRTPCAPGLLGRRRDDRGQLVEGLVQRLGEQVLLAGDVVVDRGLREAELTREVAHARAVVALPVEQRDRTTQHGRLVVARPSPARPLGRAVHAPTLGQVEPYLRTTALSVNARASSRGLPWQDQVVCRKHENRADALAIVTVTFLTVRELKSTLTWPCPARPSLT